MGPTRSVEQIIGKAAGGRTIKPRGRVDITRYRKRRYRQYRKYGEQSKRGLLRIKFSGCKLDPGDEKEEHSLQRLFDKLHIKVLHRAGLLLSESREQPIKFGSRRKPRKGKQIGCKLTQAQWTRWARWKLAQHTKLGRPEQQDKAKRM